MKVLHVSARLLGALLTALVAVAAPGAMGPADHPGPLQSQPVSGLVVATWDLASDALPASHRLHFLVLWRGTPGWLWTGSFGTRSSLLGGRSNDPAPHTIGQDISIGDTRLDVNLDVQHNVLIVAGESVSLRDTNVVLVDEADASTGPRVVGKLWVAPELSTPSAFEEVIRRGPALRAFLQCDVEFGNTQQKAVAKLLCDRTLGTLVGPAR